MNTTAHLVSEELAQDPKAVCFDGTNLHILNALRQYFSEYNLTVIDNAEPHVSCMYQFICGPLMNIKTFTANQLRTCQKRVIVIQEASTQEAEDISQTFNAHVARIGDTALSTQEARVVFGLLFSKEATVITISEPSPKTLKKTLLQTTISRTERSEQKENEHVHWDKKEKDIQTLVHDMYLKKDPERKRSYTKFVLPLRYALLTLGAFFSLHFLSLIVSLFILTSFLNGTPNILSSALPTTLDISVVTGRVITQPFSQITINSFYKRVIDNLDRISIILKEINSFQRQDAPISAVTKAPDESLLLMIESLKKSWGKISPILALMEGDIKLSKQQLSVLPQVTSALENTQNKLGEVRERGETLSVFSGLLTELTSQDKTYLLLFQNSNELRPTGGFIGSVGFLTFKNNSFSSLSVEDVYTIDGQLRGHVDPPLPIRTILSQEHWYLRDSNWSPDFETSAEKALWFVDKSTGQKANGVIGISLSTVEELLAIVGPINLPDFQTIIDKDNLFTFIHKSTQEDFFPGSQKKRDVLTALSKAIEMRVRNASAKELFHISMLLAQEIKSRDIQFYSTDSSLQQKLAQLKLTGSFPPQTPCSVPTEQYCARDLFAVVEANLAVNKTNAYVTREFARDINIENKELVRQDSIKWTNAADTTSVGGGNYTLYSRLYYPSGTSIRSLTINDVKVEIQTATMSSRPLPYAEFLDEFPGIVTVGVAQDILVGSSAELLINSTQSLPTKPYGYALSVFRQAGTSDTPFSLSISSPQQTSQTTVKDSFLVANNGSFTYNRRLQRDEQVFIALTSEDP